MSTHSCITIKDDQDRFTIYKHSDGYPTGVAAAIQDTLDSGKTWGLPRFEAVDWAAGFVAANKTGGGNIYLTKSPRRHGDIEYNYIIWQGSDNALMIEAQNASNWDKWNTTRIFRGPLSEFLTNAEAIENGDYPKA